MRAPLCAASFFGASSLFLVGIAGDLTFASTFRLSFCLCLLRSPSFRHYPHIPSAIMLVSAGGSSSAYYPNLLPSPTALR